MTESSIHVVLRERASLQPNHTAFTFLDYEQDWEGVAASLTWAQLYRRSLNLALELKGCGSTGDRAVILAPQGLDYIVAFLGALESRTHRSSTFGSRLRPAEWCTSRADHRVRRVVAG